MLIVHILKHILHPSLLMALINFLLWNRESRSIWAVTDRQISPTILSAGWLGFTIFSWTGTLASYVPISDYITYIDSRYNQKFKQIIGFYEPVLSWNVATTSNRALKPHRIPKLESQLCLFPVEWCWTRETNSLT